MEELGKEMKHKTETATNQLLNYRENTLIIHWYCQGYSAVSMIRVITATYTSANTD